MADDSPLTESSRGYLSEESKRRFTLITGVLGAVVFLAQMLLPMLLMFAFMLPMMAGGEVSTTDVTQAALWRDELWLVEQTTRLDFRDPKDARSTLTLRRLRLADLDDAGPAIPLDAGTESAPALLAMGDRLWVIGADAVRYYEGGRVTRVSGSGRPAGASKPFVSDGVPAVLSMGDPPVIASLQADGAQAVWTEREVRLDLPPQAGSLRGLQAVEAGGRLYLVAELCTREPDQCSLRYRAIEEEEWHSLVSNACACASWTAIELGGRIAVVLSEREKGEVNRLAMVTLGDGGPSREAIQLEGGRISWTRWGALPRRSDLVLISQGMPGSLRLAEIEVPGGRVRHSVRKAGSFPFGGNMMAAMALVQMLPVLLSLLLAFVLTALMRRHRVQEYVFAGERREFASLWRRAVAQLVDLVPIVAGFLFPMAGMWRMISDPEAMLESGPAFPLLFFGLFIASFVWALLVLVGYSYLEGRFGKTPGKWLAGIRVIGTDLRFCGFGRALLRNLLTFVDGFFNFLVGALIVAFTEHWQRLGDMAARTIVVVDDKKVRP